MTAGPSCVVEGSAISSPEDRRRVAKVVVMVVVNQGSAGWPERLPSP